MLACGLAKGPCIRGVRGNERPYLVAVLHSCRGRSNVSVPCSRGGSQNSEKVGDGVLDDIDLGR